MVLQFHEAVQEAVLKTQQHKPLHDVMHENTNRNFQLYPNDESLEVPLGQDRRPRKLGECRSWSESLSRCFVSVGFKYRINKIHIILGRPTLARRSSYRQKNKCAVAYRMTRDRDLLQYS